MNRAREAAFSLVELLIVLAVLGILSAAGVIGYRQLWVRAELNRAVSVFETELELARRTAKSEDRSVTFAARSDGGEWRVQANGRSASLGAAQLSTEVNLTLTAPYGTLDLDSAEGTANTVRVGDRSVTLNVVGVLAKTVVTQ